MTDATPPEAPPELRKDPAVQTYFAVAFAALAVLAMALLERGYGVAGLIPPLAGAGGLVGYVAPPFRRKRRSSRDAPGALAKFRLGPPLVLLTLAGVEVFFGWMTFGTASSGYDLPELLIAASVLAYLAAQYRVFSLLAQGVPADPRPAGLGSRRDLVVALAGDEPTRRPPDLVDAAELPRLLGTLVAALALAVGVWALVLDSAGWDLGAGVERRLNLPLGWWRLLVMIWLFGGGVVLARAVFGHLALRTLSPAEAGLILQDESWAQSRREQRRIARWRAWLRWQRTKKE